MGYRSIPPAGMGQNVQYYGFVVMGITRDISNSSWEGLYIAGINSESPLLHMCSNLCTIFPAYYVLFKTKVGDWSTSNRVLTQADPGSVLASPSDPPRLPGVNPEHN